MTATDTIDRIAPTRRPQGRIAMRQRWAELLFLHWKVPAAQLQRFLPPGLTIDTFDGNAYIGLVPFTMTGVRPVWSPPIPALSDFHETNVRTYVHREGKDPGVWFFSLDAANAIAVQVARMLWKLPYHYAKMSLEKAAGPEPVIAYETNRIWPGPTPASCTVTYRPAGTPSPAQTGTLEHFLVERYILYAARNKHLYQGRVHHKPYPLQQAEVLSLEEDLIDALRIFRPDAAPLAHYASEVSVDVYPLRKIS